MCPACAFTIAHKFDSSVSGQGYNIILRLNSQQTQIIEPMFDQCWAAVFNTGPTLILHWFNDLGLVE